MTRVLLALTVLYGGFAIASHGGESGGGGNSIVCRNTDGSIKSVELLDLYEGRALYGLEYQESADDWKIQMNRVVRPFDGGTGIAPEILSWTRQAARILHLLPEGTALKPVHDSLEVIIPVGCEIRQTAIYQNDDQILVDSEIWSALSNTQKAALVVHEGIYRMLRGHGERDSRRARHFNAHLFAGGAVEDSFPGNDSLSVCVGNGTGFYVFPSPRDPSLTRVQFASLHGRTFLSKKYFDFFPGDIDKPSSPAVFAEELNHPSTAKSVWYGARRLESTFEPGDEFYLRLEDGVVKVGGTLASDSLSFGPATIRCHGKP